MWTEVELSQAGLGASIVTEEGRGWVMGGGSHRRRRSPQPRPAQGCSSSRPAPHRKRCRGDREGGLAAPQQLECRVCASSWRPELGRRCLAAALLFSPWGQVWGR